MSRKILIYGGTGGIGSAISRQLQSQGDEVFLVGRDAGKADSLAAMDRVHFISGDVTSEGVFDRVMKEVGPELNGLVYAVGSINLGSLRRLGAADFARDFQLNATGAALAVKAALTPMKKGGEGAAIVLFSSVAAIQGFSMHASVSMAKGAVSGLTLALAAELAPRIRVNAIAPSLTRTPLAEQLLSNDEAVAALAAQHPLKRLGLPEDIARLAVFLLSRESSWVSGQIISADGGRSSLQTSR